MTQTATQEGAKQPLSQERREDRCIARLSGVDSDQQESFLQGVNLIMKKGEVGAEVAFSYPRWGTTKCLCLKQATLEEARTALGLIEQVRDLLPEGATLEVTQV